jgi:hypothetical protein
MDHVERHCTEPPASAPPPAGRVLRVKLGTNPNSSSVGSALPTYLVFVAASGALTAMLLHLTSAVGALLRRPRQSDAPSVEPPRADGTASHEPASPDRD